MMILSNNRHIKILAFASSTGGTEALEKILRLLPVYSPPIVIVQHMPTGFTKLFADRLNTLCALDVSEARNNDILRPGQALVAPADYHMRLQKLPAGLGVECFVGQKRHGVMPCADVLMESVADFAEDKAIGVVLTGMGADGAEGLLQMRRKGAKTIAQNQETSVVYGMPKMAYEIGAAEFVLPLDMIAEKIISLL